MTSVFATSIWLYLGDVIFIGALITGLAAITLTLARRLHRRIAINERNLRNFMLFQIAWLAAGLVLFKFIILQGGPNFNHLVGTGNHGSVQFSTIGELCAGLVTGYGLARWFTWAGHHIINAAKPTECRHEEWDGVNPHCHGCGQLMRDISTEVP